MVRQDKRGGFITKASTIFQRRKRRTPNLKWKEFLKSFGEEYKLAHPKPNNTITKLSLYNKIKTLQKETGIKVKNLKYRKATKKELQRKFNKLKYIIGKEKKIKINKVGALNNFGLTEFSVNFNNNNNLQHFYDAVIKSGEEHKLDNIRIYIDYNERTVSTKIISMEKQVIENAVENLFNLLIQSGGNENLTLSELNVAITGMKTKGGCCDKIPTYLINRKGFFPILNKDNLCGQRALLLGVTSTKNRKKMYRNSNNFERKLRLFNKCYNLPDGAMSFTDFESVKDYKIIIITEFDTVLYKTENEGEKIYIYYDSRNNHYNLIENINLFTGENNNYKWCNLCNKRYLKKRFKTHNCVGYKCKLCCANFSSKETFENHYDKNNLNNIKWQNCKTCNGVFVSKECLKNHDCNKKGFLKWRCGKCGKWLKSNDEKKLEDIKESHRCGEIKCSFCDEIHLPEENHRCYIQRIKDESKNLEKIYAYDFESKFDENGKHIVNYVNIQKLYSNEEWSFDTLDEFVNWLIKQKNATFIAHNAKSYDGWLIHKYLVDNTNQRPSKIITAGQKIMYMKFKSLRFLDSMNHVAQPLKNLPAVFGLDEEQFKKGYFPYTFNTDENQDYVGKIPDIEYFECNKFCKTLKQKIDFLIWYFNQKNNVYDFKNELIEYCKSDVNILKKAMEIYRNESIELNGIDPLKSVTIASYALKVYRTNHIPENKIAVLTKEESLFSKRSLRGGRTNAIRLYKKWNEKEISEGIYGRYQDIQSLYPTVQYYDSMPCGIPKIHKFENGLSDEKQINDMVNSFGIIECDIECPDDLFHPVLVGKDDDNGKVKATLLKKVKECFTTAELKKAVDKGYIITKIYEFHEYEKTNTLFKSYVANFLKVKVQYSGFKGTVEEFKKYNEELYKRFSFKIIADKIENEMVINDKNNGRRNIAKLLLNSLWGKLGQRLDLPQNKYITKPSDWFKMLKLHNDKKIELKTEKIVGDSIYITYIDTKSDNSLLGTTNTAIASFVTSQARLRLYTQLEKLDQRVLYFDTDSMIYEYNKNEYNIPDGKFLGEWECETGGNPIHEYVGIAPKSYGYKYYENGIENINVKSKGFSLNLENQRVVNFDKYKSMVFDNSITATTKNLIFNKTKNGIFNKPMDKVLGFKYDKRAIVDTIYTVPFGYASK
jgi:hypothetical protein